MKLPLIIVLAASLLLSGCSVFQRSPTWDSVVASRGQYSDTRSAEGKDGYLGYLHQVLLAAGVEHKFVTYQFHYHNAHHEEAVETATAILYRDSTTPQNPWWVMDDYHRTPVWLPSWELDAQLEFFIQRQAEVISVKDFAGTSDSKQQVARVKKTSKRALAHTPKEKKFRALFTGSRSRPKTEKPAKPPVAPADTDPLTSNVLSGRSAATGDANAEAIFRSTHGTAFDPGSSTDRAKMDALRRQLLNRSQRIGLRTQ